MDEIRIIVLDTGHLDRTVRKFEKGWIVRFVYGSSLLGRTISVKTTLTGDEELKWNKGYDQLNHYCDVKCSEAGSFKYTFYSENECLGSGYFLVMPSLSINGEHLPLSGVVCQTYLSKLLGPLPEWKSRLLVAPKTGYNMVHLTPIQELGVSNSSYSLSDHQGLLQTIHTNEAKFTLEDVAKVVDSIEKDWGVLTVQDVVWNHAAKNAGWLQKHPESSYNCLNSPHLRPAYAIDRAYHHFSKEVSEGKWEHRGIPKNVDNIHHINAIEYILRTEVLTKLKLHEYYQVDIEKLILVFSELCRKGPTKEQSPDASNVNIQIDPLWRRFGRSVDMDEAEKAFNVERHDCGTEEERINRSISTFRDHLNHLNIEGGAYAWDVLMSGLSAMMGHITYERIADNGPHISIVSESSPLTCDYFLHLLPSESAEADEAYAFSDETAPYLMAFNGWVMSSNPLENFALENSEVYLRRQLVCWGDSVKLNYGEEPKDCPFLWNYMKEYTESVAKIFHGLRIDNAHGTPIHVAEYLLQAARKIRPDLFVFAELFTGSEDLDNLFVNRLGISSLIREAQSAHDSHEQGRLVHRYSGDGVGAMIQKSVRLAPSVVASGLFLDLTHDNPCAIDKRSAYDILPTAAMVSMATCSAGSTRGYDDLIPFPIHVVTEKRPYGKFGVEVTENSGITGARKILNDLHVRLARENYSQIFVDQMNPDVVGITRHNPIIRSTVVVVSHTMFDKHSWKSSADLKWIPVGGVLEEVLFEMSVSETPNTPYKDSDDVLVGLENFNVEIREHLSPQDSFFSKLHGDMIELTNFRSGTVVAFKIRLTDENHASINDISLLTKSCSDYSKQLSENLSKLNLSSFNHLLFCCNEEEHTLVGSGCYDIPNFGKFVYAGLKGLIPVVDWIREHNDLGHPLCENLRNGTWLPEYIVDRLRKHGIDSNVVDLFEELFGKLKNVPYYLRPCYFVHIVRFIYDIARRQLLLKLGSKIAQNSSIVRMLGESTVSFVGSVPGATLAELSPKIAEKTSDYASLSAGLPHFSTGIWRNWGRDTFIALPGCLLATSRFDEARAIILSYAGCLRHGLIPNLLAEGIGARFNCRDAVWFWLKAIVRYVQEAPDGHEILSSTVRRMYPNDDTSQGGETKEQPLSETIYEALNRHFCGISYRERNAGSSIDEHMKDEGFNVNVWVDRENGFVYGGNRLNCGTWMDKMGSSDKAQNRGLPATPRDGAAVELQGLAVSVFDALSEWNKKGIFSYDSVEKDGEKWTWADWAKRIRENFEKMFFVPENATDELVNQVEIIKDTVGSTLRYSDFQLRCNFPIALAECPNLMDPAKAWKALDKAKDNLVSTIGIKTLDPSDWEYNGFYNNSDDSENKATARGWNYHQGPEWVWVAATYLKARLLVGKLLGGTFKDAAESEVQRKLGNYYSTMKKSPWSSLPELTQENGIHCPDSCDAQAWSIGCLLDVCLTLQN